MLDEEEKAAQEIAKTTDKGVGVLQRIGGFSDEVFGDSLRQFGGVNADWVRYFRYRNLLTVIDKVQKIHNRRETDGRLLRIPPQFALPLLDGASWSIGVGSD